MADNLLDTLTDDFRRLKRQKARKMGGVEGRVLLNIAFALGEQYLSYRNMGLYPDPQEDNKLQLVFNMIGPRLSKLLGRITAIAPVFRAQPDKRGPDAMEKAEVANHLIVGLDQKLDQPSKTWEIAWWMTVGGVAFEHTPWIPNATVEPMPQFDEQGQLLFKMKQIGMETVVPQAQMEQMVAAGTPPEMFEIYEEVERVGEVGSEVFGPLQVFIDQSVKSIDSLAPDQRVYIARIRTTGWVKENFGVEVEADKDFQIVSTNLAAVDANPTAGVYLRDLVPLLQGSADDTDPDMVTVVEAYTPASEENPHGRFAIFIPGKQLLHDAENPYEEVPIVDFHWKPVTTSFWTADYVTDLIAPQRFINKRMSQLGEQANATIYANPLLGGTLKKEDIAADYPAPIENGLNQDGVKMVQRMDPPELPVWFMESIELVGKMFNDVAGGADLFQESKFPGQLRGPLAVPMLQEILDTEWGPVYAHIGERMARVKQMRLNRVKQFYPPIRTMHYTSRDLKDETLIFNTEKILNSGVNYTITIERAGLMPELRALREARVTERLRGPLSIMYMDERTGKFDKSKIAADLHFGDAGRESREAQYRKLGAQITEMIWKGEQVPPPLPFYDHAVMLDELEAAMATLEYQKASPPIQQAFSMRYEAHRAFLVQEAQQQQQAMQQGAIQGAVAQATQQAAAQAASMAVEEAMEQVRAQKQLPTRQYVDQAAQQTQRVTPAPRPGRERKVVVTEREPS